MILRSRKIPAKKPPEPKAPSTPLPRNLNAIPRTPQSELKSLKVCLYIWNSQVLYKYKNGLAYIKRLDFTDYVWGNDEAPATPVKRSRLAKNKRKRSDGVHGQEESPLRESKVCVHFQVPEQPPVKPDHLSSIYSPVLNFFSPRNGGPDCCSPPVQKVRRKCPKQETPYFSELPIDDSKELFSPHVLMCTLPPPSNGFCSTRKDIPLKTRSSPACTLVLDLDDTLVHCCLSTLEDAQFTFPVLFQGNYYKVYMKLRPRVREFLEVVSKMFEMLVFTTAKREYAEKILDVLDPKRKLIRHRLFQEHCMVVLGHYIKNLNVLQRDLAKTVVLDNVPHKCPYQNLNRIPVKSWLGDPEDEELLNLLPALEKMTQVVDVRTEIAQRYHRVGAAI